MNQIYKIIPSDLWHLFQNSGTFHGSPVDLEDGFIHFSYDHQLYETARKHFSGQRELILLSVASAPLKDALRAEASRGGDYFPHLYAPLEIHHVLWSKPLPLGADGVPIIPALEDDQTDGQARI
jgi:uncharacterized protein (DUF952 family)